MRETLIHLFESAPDAMFLSELLGTIVDVNPAAEHLTGYNRQELTGKSLLSLQLIPLHRTPNAESLLVQIAIGRVTGPDEFRLTRKDRSEFTVEIQTFPANVKDATLALVVARDITMRKQREESLLLQNGMFQAITQSAQDAIVVMDSGGNISFWNAAAERIFGWTEREVIGTNLHNLIVPSRFHEAHKNAFPKFQLTGEGGAIGKTLELLGIRRDHSEIDVALSLSGILLKGEWHAVGIMREITDQKHGELVRQVLYDISREAITTEKMNGFFDSIRINLGKLINTRNFYIALYDRRSGWVSFPCFVDEEDPVPKPRMLGKGLTDYVIRTGLPLFADAQTCKDLEQQGHIRTIGSPSALWLGVPLKMEEKVFGAIVVQSYHDPKCYTNADMEIMEFVANQISHMIDRQRAEEALLRSDKEFRQLFDDAPVGYHELDHEGRIVRVNQTELTSLGYTAEEILGHFVWEFLDDQEASRQSVLAKLSGTKLPAKGVERLYRRKDLTTITVVSEDIVLRDADGRITGIRTTLQDITELKRSEGKIRQQLSIIEETNVELAQARDKAMEASKTKSSFLANMSHELRTPLNAIIGYSEILLEEMHDVNEISYANDIDKIRIAGNNLLALINDILDLSKIEAGRMDLFIEEFSLQCLLKEIEATIKPLVDKKSNTLTIRQPEPSILLRLDQTKIRQILFNLLSNSCKFTERGEVTLAVGMDRSPAADARDVVVFSVKDSGIGMTPEQMTKLFKEFSQADSSTTRKYGGTGLGLAITKRFCEMMKGTIEVQSVPMEGTTFTVTLPVSLDIQEHPSVASGVVLEDSTPVAPSAGRTVLIIDDDPNVWELLTRMFTKDGYSVQTAGSGNDGLAIARKILPMAIILDVMMPQKDGWAVLREIKDDPVLKSIPVIMHTIIDNRSLGFAIGAQDYLIKPVDHDKLLQTLARHKQFSRAMNILIIDDEPNQREMLSRILLNDGWNVRTADGGQSALSLLAQSLPDVMILDLKMPTMDGFEFLKLVKEHDQWSSIPIIILTSMDLSKSVHDQLSGSVATILRKGECNPQQLLAIVHRYGRPQAVAPRSSKEGTDENNSAR